MALDHQHQPTEKITLGFLRITVFAALSQHWVILNLPEVGHHANDARSVGDFEDRLGLGQIQAATICLGHDGIRYDVEYY